MPHSGCNPFSDVMQKCTFRAADRDLERQHMATLAQSWHRPSDKRVLSLDIQRFWTRTTALMIADSSDETEFRVEQAVMGLRADFADGIDPCQCLKTFHWKILELGPASLAACFQVAWKNSVPLLSFPMSKITRGRCVLRLSGLTQASMAGSEDLAQAIMTRYFAFVLAKGASALADLRDKAASE
jgi:hypothetical protein